MKHKPIPAKLHLEYQLTDLIIDEESLPHASDEYLIELVTLEAPEVLLDEGRWWITRDAGGRFIAAHGPKEVGGGEPEPQDGAGVVTPPPPNKETG